MKLYFSPGSCSLSPHIVLGESKMAYKAEKVDLAAKKLSNGDDFFKITPKGQVPTLQLDSGEVLTEGAVIVQYIADQKPESGLMPKAGTVERYHCQEWLNFIATELHKGFGPMFRADRMYSPEVAAPVKASALKNLQSKFEYVNNQLQGKDYLLGAQFSVADAYLFTMLTWSKRMNLDLGKVPNVMNFYERVQNRPAVQEVLKAEAAAQ